MVARSLAATPQGLKIATKALTGKGWSKEDLAGKVEIQGKKTTTGIGIATVKKFFSGKKVDRKYFVGICNALGEDWEAIAGEKATVAAIPKLPTAESDIDALVQRIRQQVKADIHHRCGTMRVLDMEQPIGLGDIYTEVNILEKLSGHRRLGIEELLQDCNSEDFDRFLLGQVRHERVPGLEAVEHYNRLMILGKPGAGKTTFLKRLATLCNLGEFQPERVPVFVTLKEFAEAKGRPDLRAFIAQQWQDCGVQAEMALPAVLTAGKALVLLDGLDEVQETEHDRVLQQIVQFTNQFRDCQFVITCRIAAREYTFQHFTEVEVADFTQAQIAEFASKWFAAKQDPDKSKPFIQRLKDNKPIQELATNPLLLTLLCLVFGEAADFPRNRAELYKEGLDVLLKKWDAKRNIERDQVYKKLSLKRKEDLLSQLAFHTFERGDYFFKQVVVEQHIANYICNLPGANEDEVALQLDSEAVLKSIEAQHGLLVERARGIYSFSHLTFQEYFVAKQITSPTAKLPAALANLVSHIAEPHYREVFLLAVGMLPEADDLIKLMKQQVDFLLAEDPDLQALLVWLDKKSQSVSSPHTLVQARSFYLSLLHAFDDAFNYSYPRNQLQSLSQILEQAQTLEQTKELVLESVSISLSQAVDFDIELPFDYALDLNLNTILDRIRAFDYVVSMYFGCIRYFRNVLDIDSNVENVDADINLFLSLIRLINPSHIFKRAISQVRASQPTDSNNAQLIQKLDQLSKQLPNFENWEEWKDWWYLQKKDWVSMLRAIMMEHRNIGHDWKLNESQEAKLNQYYKANQFLVQCLNSDCYVTKATRQAIEETLLLPVSKLEPLPESAG